MPPKKKGKGKKGKKKGKKKNDGELTVEDKYKKTLLEIDALKDHLDNRRDISRRSQAQSEEWKTRMKAAEGDVEQQKSDQKDVMADMTRQYKTKQTEMDAHVRRLEVELQKVTSALTKTSENLKATTAEKEKITKEKNETIGELEEKIKTMEYSYENMLEEAMDNMVDKLNNAKIQWLDESRTIHMQHKQKLLEFGLNPLDI
ncbi:coiled-coil domain-containing protein 153 [Strongylocentrotus purpuratus]|uniref:Dynein regulatory complex protein 12 n=1 Tax=Strongylocentrotus purpuratus TaxID=7668 RepID=A0A7M7NCK8_STRPU|nr:coiled-coil domain-containing protein 153 [Strongylocentrotus purpuratus]XP_030833679.1 coiled-coil domain-containing protein 153 [Strongylocentrotus purpuratus]